jgi:peptidoglycan hydrolase-like protein with peptidoglycan-binding domain
MPNPGQPTISLNAHGDAVRRAQRALRRTPDLSVAVDGIFGAVTEQEVKTFQEGAGITADGIVGPITWNALPDGGPMPTLQEGKHGDVVRSLQTILADGAAGEWNTGPGPVDGEFGPKTRASVVAFQKWGHVSADGVVGDQTWGVSLDAMSSDLESVVGLQYVIG